MSAVNPPILYGSENPSASLIESVVLTIRIEYARGSVTQVELATRYRVTPQAIGYIVRGRTWIHVGGPRTFRGSGRHRPLPPYKEEAPPPEPVSAHIEQRVRPLAAATQPPL